MPGSDGKSNSCDGPKKKLCVRFTMGKCSVLPVHIFVHVRFHPEASLAKPSFSRVMALRSPLLPFLCSLRVYSSAAVSSVDNLKYPRAIMPAWLTLCGIRFFDDLTFGIVPVGKTPPTAGCLHLLASVPVVAMLLRCVFCVCIASVRLADQQILFRLSSLGLCLYLFADEDGYTRREIKNPSPHHRRSVLHILPSYVLGMLPETSSSHTHHPGVSSTLTCHAAFLFSPHGKTCFGCCLVSSHPI